MNARKMTLADLDRIPSHRADTIAKAERLAVARALDSDHERNKDRTELPGHSINMIAGPRGCGKTNVAMLMAALYGYGQGLECFFTMSSLFGYRVDGLDVALFNQQGPDYSFLVADELHLILPRIRSGSLYNTTIIQSFAAARKKQLTFMGITSQEQMVDPYFKVEVDWVFYPIARRPEPNERNPRTGQFYPAWAYLNIRKIGPKPFRSGRTLIESYEDDLPNGSPKVYGPKPKMAEFPLPPALVYRAACLSSSFEQLPSDAASGMNVMAKDVRRGLDNYDRSQGQEPESVDMMTFASPEAQERAAEAAAEQEAEKQRQAALTQEYLMCLRRMLETEMPTGTTVHTRFANHRIQLMMEANGMEWPGDREANRILGTWVGTKAGLFRLEDVWKLWPDTRENPPEFRKKN